ncbi:MAG: CBS domain-containing protein [candidate division Zixibacteria bacterium]|nr:CBS domain-containing protein [candidate division Zixibacteria bacterium]
MSVRLVKDLMIPLGEYAVVSDRATLMQAVQALERAQQTLPSGMHRHRAILVTNAEGQVVGKVGYLAFLRSMEPQRDFLGDSERLEQAGVSREVLDSTRHHMSFFQDDLEMMCTRAAGLKVKDVMEPAREGISEDAPLAEAIHRFDRLQSQSVLVTRKGNVVGLLRLSDLYTEVASIIRSLDSGQSS